MWKSESLCELCVRRSVRLCLMSFATIGLCCCCTELVFRLLSKVRRLSLRNMGNSSGWCPIEVTRKERKNEEGKTLHTDVLELILSRLPSTDVARAACVCKQWHSIVRSPAFLKHFVPQEAWLFVDARRLMISPLARKFNLAEEAWLFVNARRFVVSPFARGFNIAEDYGGRFPDCRSVDGASLVSLIGAGGIVYALTGSNQSKLSYKLHPLAPDWNETPSMRYGRHNPLVGLVRAAGSFHYKIIVAGGALAENRKDIAAVEIYSSETGSWEQCESLPVNEFSFTLRSPALYTTTAVLKNKLYVNHLGRVSVFDLTKRAWSTIDMLVEGSSPRTVYDVRSSHLLTCAGQLLLIGLQHSEDKDVQFRVWKLDEYSMKGVECTHECDGLKPTSILKTWMSAARFRQRKQSTQGFDSLGYIQSHFTPGIYC
ncbi:hypothetical protein Mapa_008507 [Marchantia paleacea]|nr:hypothetical protein Mapa_008507 [Marchantia paleacea]